MPTNKSTLKRLRTSKKAHLRNKMVKSALKTAEKRFLAAVEAGDKEAAADALKVCFSKLDKASKRNVIHANKAANKKSRLNKRFNAIAG